MEETNTIEGGQVDGKREKMNVALALAILVVAVGASYFILNEEKDDSNWRAELEEIREQREANKKVVQIMKCVSSPYSITNDPDRYSFSGAPSDYGVIEGVAHWDGIAIPELDVETFERIGSFHFRDKNTVWYERYINDSPAISVLVPISGADPVSFEILIENSYNVIARDKEHVFFNHADGKDSGIVEGIDPSNFVILGNYIGYAKDNNNVYKIVGYSNDGSIEPVTVIEGADPDTFSVCGDRNVHAFYVKDTNTVWYTEFDNGERLKVLEGADAETFEVMAKPDERFARDKRNVYRGGYPSMHIIEDADPKTFVLLGDRWPRRYAKDHSNVWYLWGTTQKVEGADAETFVDLEDGMAKDKNRSYQDGQAI